MPITPFHFGPGLLCKAYAPAHVSWTAFALANLLIDLEPVAWFLWSGEPAHRQLHSYLGATLAAALAVWPGRALCELWLRGWNRQLSPAQARWLGVATRVSLTAALTGAALGAYSHILLDSFMHADMRPFWPWADGNTLLHGIPVDGLHLACIAAGGWGGARLALLARIRWPDTRAARVTRIAGRLLEQTVGVFLLLVALLYAVVHLADHTARGGASLDAAVWRATPPMQHFGNPRVPMANDTLARLRREQPTRQATLVLLGPPDAGDNPRRVSYYLGFSGWLALDPDTLDIEFSHDGRFLAARIVQH